MRGGNSERATKDAAMIGTMPDTQDCLISVLVTIVYRTVSPSVCDQPFSVALVTLSVIPGFASIPVQLFNLSQTGSSATK